MTEAIDERVRRYILDGSDQDLRRLLSISEVTSDMARTAFHRVGVQPGWRALDCGCGPIGALAILAELVGPGGRVVGVDFSEAAVEQARSVAAALGLGNVEVTASDIHDLDPAALGGPFDLAYTRLFFIHQANPVETLRQIAGLLRPGGWLLVHDALRTPPPRSHPDLPALGEYWELLHQVIERAGVPSGVVEDLPRSARAAGLEVSRMSGSFITTDPALSFELHAATLAAGRERAIRSGIASGEQIDDLLRRLRGAANGEYAWVSTPFFLELTLRKPGGNGEAG